MLRRLASFTFWLSLFGLFLSVAAYSTGNFKPSLFLLSLAFLWLSWRVLRKPKKNFDPTRRFRALRRLGLIEGQEASEEE